MMSSSLQGQSFLTLADTAATDLRRLVATGLSLKAEKRRREFPRRLAQRNIALIFLEPSLRTRAAFAVAAADEGAHLEVLRQDDLRFGVKESTRDIARVLGRQFDAIAMRADHATIETFARSAGVPVWNALSPEHHPTQALADMMTIHEAFGRVDGIRVAFVGDGRSNVAASLAHVARRWGFHLAIVSPRGRWPGPGVADGGDAGWLPGSVRVTDSVDDGVAGADVVYGDIWVSMGQEAGTAGLVAALAPYRITAATLAATGNPDAIFLHCLPALHDDTTQFAQAWPDVCDVSDDVFESARSRVFDQSENRMHTIKALMLHTLAGATALSTMTTTTPEH